MAEKFNPQVPLQIRERSFTNYSLAQKAVQATLAKDPGAKDLWLELYKLHLQVLNEFHNQVGHPKLVQADHRALNWIKLSGKFNWL
jgi:hypothetical protein